MEGWIMKKVIDMLADIRPEFDFSESQSFIEDGYLDSFDLVSLVTELSDEFDIQITAKDFIEENFNSLAALVAMVDRLVEE